MLRLATEDDLPLVRKLITDGAKAGSFDPALAQPTNEADAFFFRLRGVISGHFWLRPAPVSRTDRAFTATPAGIWVFEERSASPGAIGFIAARNQPNFGYELWLVAIKQEHRGRGLGKQMAREFLATRVGRQIMVAQCDLRATGARQCADILCQAGFQSARRGSTSEWIVNPRLHPAALAWLKTTPFRGSSPA
jgi:Acetyltransferase (GNAT) domain